MQQARHQVWRNLYLEGDVQEHVEHHFLYCELCHEGICLPDCRFGSLDCG